MAWIALVANDLRLTESERAILETTDPISGATPVTDALTDATKLVRSKVAACGQNSLDADAGKIPDELKLFAVSIATFYLLTSVPTMAGLLTQEREKAYDDAMRELKEVAMCRTKIVQPATPTTETLGTAAGVYGSNAKVDFSYSTT